MDGGGTRAQSREDEEHWLIRNPTTQNLPTQQGPESDPLGPCPGLDHQIDVRGRLV